MRKNKKQIVRYTNTIFNKTFRNIFSICVIEERTMAKKVFAVKRRPWRMSKGKVSECSNIPLLFSAQHISLFYSNANISFQLIFVLLLRSIFADPSFLSIQELQHGNVVF